ncbi:hypothetical protein OE88DRAFT_1666830 [Heliocybe sulcata]|uniref:Fibronectin type III/BRCA1 domain-containing protein n=1 Tax=Heliocybe sulcata TaxID=5364 RepID=A0A5C3MRJ4_9AGAM|nr:hypothetical protein OE88DRAFT_1666830 [Heliocybe sulcata]
MAILLGERAHLIEFPSLLLPPGTTAGSIVNISVTQNHAEEKRRDNGFWALQNEIMDAFGRESPEPPNLQLRNVTQTSVTLEWPPLKLATAKLRSLDIYRNGQRLAAIPSAHQNTSTKLSGLDINTEYSFQLVLRTSAGTYPSNVVRVRTHTMTDTSGISVCFGNVQDLVLLENAKMALREMNAKWSEKIQIDTTHFVCTTPAATPSGAEASGSISSSPGVEYQRALQLSIPVVQPQWILACHAEKKMVPISGYYLGVNPGTPINSAPFTRPQSMSQVSLAHSPSAQRSPNRASMPAPTRSQSHQSIPAETRPIEPTPEEPTEEDVGEYQEPERTDGKTPKSAKRRTRHGTMDRAFKFPPEEEEGPESSPAREARIQDGGATQNQDEGATPPPEVKEEERKIPAVHVVAPSTVEVPPPPPVEKEKPAVSEEGEEEVGETEEIEL